MPCLTLPQPVQSHTIAKTGLKAGGIHWEGTARVTRRVADIGQRFARVGSRAAGGPVIAGCPVDGERMFSTFIKV